MTGSPDEKAALTSLAECAARAMGFGTPALRAAGLRRVLETRLASGASYAQVAEEARRTEPALVRDLQRVLAAGETFFFRHVEQFLLVRDLVLPDFALWQERPFRAWSAGCATGEEPYSLAALLLSAAPPGGRVEVLATDMLEARLETARAGAYGRWSMRGAPPPGVTLLEPGEGPERRVLARVAKAVRFEPRNLLDPPPDGPFDLIFCRNVLVYFDPTVAGATVSRLLGALAPGGAIVFGPVDLPFVPQALETVGPPSLQAYRHRRVPASAPPPRAVRAAPPPRPPPAPARIAPRPKPPAPAEPQPLRWSDEARAHAEAIELLEREREAEALAALERLRKSSPQYVPGLVELGLALGRRGHVDGALRVMREALAAASAWAPDETLAGPEPLPCHFYMDAAEAFLERHGGDSCAS